MSDADVGDSPEVFGPVPDDVPKRGLFEEPVAVTDLRARGPETLADGRRRVTFRTVVRDAAGRRCPDLAVEARLTGPERTGDGTGHTSLMGHVDFRMTGPAGTYRIEVLDVAAGGLDLDRDASVLTAEVTVA